ncbi:DUF885 domain-containing protein [Sphingomonas sp. SM33]|uniref:DUF885 domain-containing protein n=1 Tax=Sphingomonas telluris TaxID=2907998 RepID=A0ABS9VLZ5_9SPHN|nr:DUF885 domain-containing protein [Sphingomonas telluris]MCH8615997.1 DUF885 domain-containing protein [Sphingomonas telluris]
MRKFLIASVAVAALAVGGCQVNETSNQSGTSSAEAPTGDWPSFVNNFIEATFKANPGFAVMQGRHEYDGQIADLSPAAIDAEVARLKKAISDAQSFGDDELTAEQRYQRDYLVAVAKGQLFWADPEGADQLHTNPAAYLGFVDPSVYVTVPYASKEQRLKAYIKFLSNVPRAVEQMRSNIKTPMPISFVDYAKSAFGGFAEYYPGDGTAAWKGVGSDEDQQALKAASDNAVKAMKDTVAWVESQRASTKPNFALGKEKFQRMLADTEMVTTPVEELERIGRADLESNQKLLKEACARYAAGKTIPDCMAKMNSDKPEGGPVAEARRQLPTLKQFIIDKDIVTIPGPEEAKVEESPPYNRQNGAYINIPGPYEKNLPSVYYISPPDPTWSKAAQEAYIPGKADLLFTSVHEVWPGHFLNFLHANRSKDMFGRVFVGYAFAEGWAHYSEEMMRQAGVGGGTDEVLIGQLSNALLRDCRFLSAIGMHTGSMTQQQSYDLFRNQCYQDEGNAKQQAARGTYDPAYLNYTMGKLMIRKLRDDWTATRGGQKAWKAFHDQFLSYGGPPIPLVRQQMMNGKAEAVF